MSNQLALELLSLSAGLSQFNNFQILDLGRQNNVIALSPELIQFASTCSNCDNTLAQVFSSNLNLNGLNLGGCNNCLQQLVDLQGLFISGLNINDNNNDNNKVNNDNNQDNKNQTANANEDNKNAVEQEQAKADEEAKKAEEEAAAAKNETAATENENQDGKNPQGGTEGRKSKLKSKFKGRSAAIVAQRSGAAKEKVLGGAVLGLLVLGLGLGLGFGL